MKAKDLNQLGIPNGPAIGEAFRAIEQARAAGMEIEAIGETIGRVARAPEAYAEDRVFGSLAAALARSGRAFIPRTEPAPYRVWGHGIEQDALTQMRQASSLPVAIRGALMPHYPLLQAPPTRPHDCERTALRMSIQSDITLHGRPP